ncbi:SDR family NAD(P)-dependent oxidoreductase [Streptacidiphilus fuscans]|uniref:SDR family NAD(P)-dependent oxidoreductase n=1 Tax=Streptacidiphilus fuscans TaxID=2789292 RepID=A0A931BC13_9ACTN|nr:SDR family NAD(P)-dependent oxidoreductase [Streptacidiphilus fuscans]MBF9071453.1 SDR family NAD(P)-dependent oxidoreductase [Streptacidiphilus fuscans]
MQTGATQTESIAGRTVLVTGANRGIGRALVEEALRRDARRVYAATRRPFTHPDPRVRPVLLDVTDQAQIDAAAQQIEDLDLLVNNAGLAIYDDLGDREVLARHFTVNFFGPYAVTRAFTPHLTRSHGAVVNVLSLAALAAVPGMAGYSASKAAALALTQSLRLQLAAEGVRVHAVLAGPVDTDMVRNLDIPKAAPSAVAQAILDGVAAGDDEIFPDPLSATFAEDWPTGPVKLLERGNAALVADLR